MSKVLPRKPHIATPQAETDYNNQTYSQTFVASTPINLTASQLIQPLTTENHEIALASCQICVSATHTFLMEIPSFSTMEHGLQAKT